MSDKPGPWDAPPPKPDLTTAFLGALILLTAFFGPLLLIVMLEHQG